MIWHFPACTQITMMFMLLSVLGCVCVCADNLRLSINAKLCVGGGVGMPL